MKIGEDGYLYSWGHNNSGQLGTGNFISQIKPQKITFPNDEKPKSVFAGYDYAMAITQDGNLYAWGNNYYGQLGIGNTTNQTTPQLVTLPNGEKPISIFLGWDHSTMITDKENLYAWGLNSAGQLGIGSIKNQLIPTKVNLPNEEKVVSLALTMDRTVAITDKNNLYVWGNNKNSELGIPNGVNQNTPQLLNLPNNEKPISIAASMSEIFTITDKENLYGWGSNFYGNLATGDRNRKSKPCLITIPNGEKPKSIHVERYGCMVLTDSQNLYVWGRNDYGQLGIGNTILQFFPQLFELLNKEKPKFINLGAGHGAIISESGKIYIWGENKLGQSGLEDIEYLTKPIEVKLP